MNKVNAYATQDAKGPLKPFHIDRRNPGPHDVATPTTNFRQLFNLYCR